MSLLRELKRRNVFRIGIVYGITAWLIAQIAGLAADSFLAPEWVMKMIITILILGFPVAILMAWAYELTPEGLRRESNAEPGESTSPATAGKLNRTITIVLVLTVIYFGYDKFVLGPGRDTLSVQVTDQSIAVLPFVNMSEDAGNEYFAEGLSEELLNLLVKIPELRVAARTSSFSYKGTGAKIAQIGEELNVSHVLEGSVRKSGNRVRITAQLIKVDDGFHLWSETFDRTLNDIFAVQDEIASAVVAALKVNMLGAMPKPRQTDPEVYTLYLQGNYFLNIRGEENLRKALAVFQEAVAIDPNYAPAWVGLSITYSHHVRYGLLSGDEGSSLALEAAENAVATDETLASAWASLAYTKRFNNWDWDGARAAIEKAQQLEPNNADVLGTAASLANTFGQNVKSIALFERIIAVDPLAMSSLRALGFRYAKAGRFDDAIETLGRIVALNPEYPNIYRDLGLTYLLKGEPERALIELEREPPNNRNIFLEANIQVALGNKAEADATLNKILESPADGDALRIAYLYIFRGENDAAFEWLDKAFELENQGLVFILGNIPPVKLGSDPRFPIFIEKLGLLEYWKAMPPELGGPSPGI